MIQTNPFEAANVTFANNPPADPLRRAAEALCFAARLTPSQLNWAKSHDWFDSIVDAALIVTDRFTYEGHSYEERIIWAGTFAELRDWAGY
jgi:hypothetical protein